MTEVTAELYSWVVDKPILNSLGNPSAQWQRLIGIVKNDVQQRWPDGRRIFTSPIELIEGDLAFTRNSVYRLCCEWEGEWTHRDGVTGNIIVEDGPVHTTQVMSE